MIHGHRRLEVRRIRSKAKALRDFYFFFFFFQAEDGIRDLTVTGVQTCALPISGQEQQKRASKLLAQLNEWEMIYVSATRSRSQSRVYPIRVDSSACFAFSASGDRKSVV